jgi:chromosomal replication initiation ATPase DnaA
MQYNAFIMEDIEFWDERKVLHCFNLISECRKYLLMTTGSLASNFALQDLSSRINAVVRLEINQPDDELMTKLIFKYFSDQSLKVSDCVIEYLLINLPRQFDQMIKLLGIITHFALVHKRAVTVPLIKQVLK